VQGFGGTDVNAALEEVRKGAAPAATEELLQKHVESLFTGADPQVRRRHGAAGRGIPRAAERTELHAEQLRQATMARGASPIQFTSYRSFGLHVDRLTRNHSGVTLRDLVIAAIDYWSARCLRSEVPSDICVPGPWSRVAIAVAYALPFGSCLLTFDFRLRPLFP